MAQSGLRLHAPITSRVGVTAWGGAARLPNGSVTGLDGWLMAPIRVVDQDTAVIRAAPAVTLPLAGSGQSGVATPTGSGSVDPGAQLDAVVGGTWVGVGMLQARLPLVAGRDDVVDGWFTRFDLSGGRRLGGWVPTAGVSFLQQAPDANGTRGFSEVAAVAGATVELADAWALDSSVRVPLTDTGYTAALRVGVTWVAGKKPAAQPH